VLIIGAGGIGLRHIKGYTQTGRARLSVVEPDDKKSTDMAQKFALVNKYQRIDEVDLKSFDLAVICAPAHAHLPLMTKCIAADLPFMVEKPLSVSMEGVHVVLEKVRARNLLARVGFTRRVADEL